MTQDNPNELLQVKFLLSNLDSVVYASHLPILEGSSIGQHIRHIIGFYQCLAGGLSEGIVNYDNRTRDIRIEMNPVFAYETLLAALACLENYHPEQTLFLQTDTQRIKTTFGRELHYLSEHAVHHLAMVRLALREQGIPFPENLGIATATVTYRNGEK